MKIMNVLQERGRQRVHLGSVGAARSRARSDDEGRCLPDEAASLRLMLEADLIAERIAIESYREMITSIGTKDPTSRRLLESILAQEEEHAEDLVDLLEDVPKD